jgi:parallel beta-helix repeat protein/predicted outer membrane repeat protein
MRHQWVRSIGQQRRQSTQRPTAGSFPFHRRLRFEPLEERWLLANVTVGNLNDVVNGTVTSIAALIATPGADGISLREAILAANADAAADTIDFAPSVTGTIQLTIVAHVGELAITNDLAINGPAAGLLTIRAFVGTAAAGDGARVFNVTDGNNETFKNVSISGLTITGGDPVASDGAGIHSRENLSLTACTISGNVATNRSGGGVFTSFGALVVTNSTISGNTAYRGGGIYTGDNTTITGSTISGNAANAIGGNGGGGIVTADGDSNTLTITNSTISGNSANSNGGGILVANPDPNAVAITHSTITLNRADANSSGGGSGGGIHSNSAAVNIDHTIVAGNLRQASTRSDVSAAVATRFSLIGDNTGATITDNGGNQIGTGAAPVNPQLGPLANNGGSTLTHAFLAGSPALDAGDPAAAAGAVNVPLNDQRGAGFARIADGNFIAGARIDIGAYEQQSIQAASLIVDTLTDENDGNFSPGDFSLREAIGFANGLTGPNVITFAATLTSGGPATIPLTQGQLAITASMTISGPGANLLSIDATGNDPTPTMDNGDGSRVFNVSNNNAPSLIDVSISGLTLTGGDADVNGGGAIRSTENLTVADCTISGNHATLGGGIICRNELTVPSSLIIQRTTISGNTASNGGGGVSANYSHLQLLDSHVSGNTTGMNGGGLNTFYGDAQVQRTTFTNNSAGTQGGGISTGFGEFVLEDSIIADNSAVGAGGGFRQIEGNSVVVRSSFTGNSSGANGGGLSINTNGDPGFLTVTDSTISGNTASMNGGGIFSAASATTTITSSTLSGNTSFGSGGGIYSGKLFLPTGGGKVTVNSSTISGNKAFDGAGVYNRYSTIIISHSTITNNTPPSGFGGGFGIEARESSATITRLNSTIVSGNSNLDVVAVQVIDNPNPGNPFQSDGFNLIGNGNGSATFTQPGDQTGVTNPLLGPLADNGGPTMTHALLAGSPALDAGDPNFEPADPDGDPMTDDAVPHDQRGAPFGRAFDGNSSGSARIDIGAYESQPKSVLGDYNLNGTVDAADYTVWRNTLGQTGLVLYSGADGDGDGSITISDYDVWKSHFGESLPPEAGGGAATHTLTELAIKGGEAIVPVPAESIAAPVEAKVDVERASNWAILAPRSARHNSAAPPRERVNSFRVVESASDQLLLLLASDRLAHSSQQDFSVTHDRGNDDRRADDLDKQDLVDGPLALALAEWP